MVLGNSMTGISIALERQGKAEELDRIIGQTKAALGKAHASVTWRVIGNHHYGEGIEGLDVAVYRIGDVVGGEATNQLSYDCDSRPYLGIVLEEARETLRAR